MRREKLAKALHSLLSREASTISRPQYRTGSTPSALHGISGEEGVRAQATGWARQEQAPRVLTRGLGGQVDRGGCFV